MYDEARLASGLVAACTANSLLSVVSVELRCLSWRDCEAGASVGSSASFSTERMRRRSTVARTASPYLRSCLGCALSPEGRLAEADCSDGSSLASSEVGGLTFKVGRCRCGWLLLLLLPEPKIDPLPEPKSERDGGMLRCLEAEGRWSVRSFSSQGDEGGSSVGV